MTERRTDAFLQAYDDLRDAAVKLMAEFEIEEEEHGFPFNFGLRSAHADLKRVLRSNAGHPTE